MNIIPVVREVLCTSNPMVGESALPDFSAAPQDFAEGMRVGSFHQLNGVFDGHIVVGRQEKMNVFRHENKGVELETSLAPMPIHSFEEDAHVRFYDEQSSALPGRECNEVSAGWRNQSSRLHEQTSAAEAASFT